MSNNRKVLKSLFNTSLSLLALGCLSPVFSQTRKQAMVCGDTKVILIDYRASKDSIPEVVWTWDAREAKELPEEYQKKKFNSVDDCKSVNKGKQILVASSSGAIVLLDAKTRKAQFHASVDNAHSIEMLPNGYIVAAASTAKKGNKIMLFDPRSSGKALYTDSLYSAHGLVWNAKRKSLYALGYDVLREYKMEGNSALKMVNSWKIPGKSGHDLYPTVDGDGLFMTEHTGVWKFDMNTQKFAKIPGFPDAENTKSVGQDGSGQFIMTVPEESWWTFHVRFSNPVRQLAFPGMKVYKARWY